LDENRAELHPKLDVGEVLSTQVAIVDGEIDQLALLVYRNVPTSPYINV
jgi:hypothetical protein